MDLQLHVVLFREWKWYPICSACCEVFNTLVTQMCLTSYLKMHSACFYFDGYNVWYKVFKNNFYKVVSNKQLIRCNQQVLFQWTETIPIFNACHEVYKNTF